MKKYEFSDRKLKIAVLLAIAMIGWLCLKGASAARGQTTPANPSPDLQEVVKLSATHMSDDVILSYIKNSGVSYNLSADDILYLHSQEISPAVINALLKAAPDGTPVPDPKDGPPSPGVAQPVAPAPVVAGATTAPMPDADVSFSFFKTQLAPFGQWVEVSGFGPCWRPSVQDEEIGWRPYFNGGHWDYTENGWFWKSDYSWGAYAFHYGRWARDPGYGWVWAPGYQWAPAWVCWRNCESDGYCGWAPLPPAARFEAGAGLVWDGRAAADVDFGLGADAFVFIPFDHVWAHDYRAFLAPGWRWPSLYRRSVLANGCRFVGGHLVVEGIGRERIGLLTHHDFGAARFGHAREWDRAHAVEIHRGRTEDHRALNP